MAGERLTVIDATNAIAGRLSSVVAKRLLRGERIAIVNSENAIITGDPKRVLNMYMKRVSEWRTYYNPEKRGPKIPRTPDRILKRMVRGMLPKKKPKGREALKRLRVYIGVPEDLKGVKAVKVKEAELKRDDIKYITLGELSKLLGGFKVS